MSQLPHKKEFKAADIERYLSGSMPLSERHALEKAALDDPFLADAIEGYAYTASAQEDLEELNQQILSKTSRQRTKSIIPLFDFFWLRVAALIIVVIGTGFWISMSFTQKKDSVALQDDVIEKTELVSEKPAPELTVQTHDSISTNSTTLSDQHVLPENKKTRSKYTLKKGLSKMDASQKRLAPQTISSPAFTLEKPVQDSFHVAEMAQVNRRNIAESKIYEGRIIDNNGQPVPNASVMLSGKLSGVTTDAEGRFSLSASDSSKKLEASAIGFQPKSVPLAALQKNEKIILEENNASLSEVVVTGYSNAKARRELQRAAREKDKKDLEEIEPEEGWNAYNSYLTTQLKIPEEALKSGIKGEVKLDFDIDTNGQPVNIKVTKSLCEACDKEAVRLLKEGPTWKNKRNKKGSIRVRF